MWTVAQERCSEHETQLRISQQIVMDALTKHDVGGWEGSIRVCANTASKDIGLLLPL